MDADIIASVSYLFGLPYEKKDIYENTLRFFKENDLASKKLELFPYVPIAYPGTLMWDIIPPEKHCYDWEKFFISTENKIAENQIVYVNPTFTSDELDYYLENLYDVIKESGLTDKDLFMRDIETIIYEGYDAIESENDEEWFELAIKNTTENYVSKKCE